MVTRRLLKRLRRRPLHRILVEQPATQPLPAQEHVLHDVEVVGQRKVLVHRLDAEAGRVPGGADVHRTTLEEDLPVVGLVHTGDAAGQHRLAGTVVPAQPGDLAGGQIQVHLVQRLDRAEVLVDAPQLQERLHRCRRPARRSAGVVMSSQSPQTRDTLPVRAPRRDEHVNEHGDEQHGARKDVRRAVWSTRPSDSRETPYAMPPMSRPPSRAWIGLPRPPKRLVPPMTAAATEYRISCPGSAALVLYCP